MGKLCRIEYPGAFYHVTNRGNRRQLLFESDDDRRYFLNGLREAHRRFRLIVHAYCLMENHYHLFLETPWGNLSRLMHFVDLRYATYVNLKHARDGHTFQGRFAAILVQAEHYAREVAHYIHLNPVRARLVERPEDYVWSDCRAYLGLAPSESWESCAFVLGLFGDTLPAARQNYRRSLLTRLARGMLDPFAETDPTGILGSSEFVDRIGKSFSGESSQPREQAQPPRRPGPFRPTLRQVQDQTESVLGPESRLGRRIAIYLSHKITDLPLSVIGEFFSIGGPGISDICRRLDREIIHHDTLTRVIGEIELRLLEECRKDPTNS